MNEKTRILIVDDEPVNLDFFQLMLGKLGFEVVTAEDGEEALEKISTFNPDLIILDNVMPRLSGWEVTRLLKTDREYGKYRDIPIIMFSAMDDVQDKVEGFELGIEDYITKPFNFSEVLARIRAALRGHKLYDQLKIKQKKLERAEGMNTAVLEFFERLKEPLQKITESAEMELSTQTPEQGQFAELVRAEAARISEMALVMKKSLEEGQKEDAGIVEDETALEEFDSRLREHFIQLQENEVPMKKVQE